MMEQLLTKMSHLAIEDIKSRREKTFRLSRVIRSQEESRNQNNQEASMEIKNKGEFQALPKVQLPLFSEQILQKEEIHKSKNKETDTQYKKRKYWRNAFRINHRLASIPEDLTTYYVGSYPAGIKSLLIFKKSKVEIVDQNGYIVYFHTNPVPTIQGTILEVICQKQFKSLVVVDLLSWRTRLFEQNQFEFRSFWLSENLKYYSPALINGLQMEIKLIDYMPCKFNNLLKVYKQEPLYARDGLLFVQKQSYYNPRHNPQCFIWKDDRTSTIFSKEYTQNSINSKGIAFINRNGQAKSRQNIILFKFDTKEIKQQWQFVQFTYEGIKKTTLPNKEQQIEICGLQIVGFESRNFEGFTDSLTELQYKCSLRSDLIKIQDLLKASK